MPDPDLPMPSDLRGEPASAAGDGTRTPPGSTAPPIEPPSVKLIVRLFVIPLLIVGIAVAVMVFIAMLAGGTPSISDELADLSRGGGGGRTGPLVGPSAKQRYLDAKMLVDQMKAGMSLPDRIRIADTLVSVLEKYSTPEDGQMQPFLLLALGRVWQDDPGKPVTDTPESLASRQHTIDELVKYATSTDPDQATNRKAAIAAMGYWAGRPEVLPALAILESRLNDDSEILDVRLMAATVLGPIAAAAAPPPDANVLAALHHGLNDTRPEDSELPWASALSLAELKQTDSGIVQTILMLMDRSSLANLRYFDRESDPQVFRKLTEQEQERILINTMIGVRKYDVPAVQQKLKSLADNDPSERVRLEGRELLTSGTTAPTADQ